MNQNDRLASEQEDWPSRVHGDMAAVGLAPILVVAIVTVLLLIGVVY